MRIGISAVSRLHGGGFTHLSRLLEAWGASACGHEFVLFTRRENVPLLAHYLRGRIEVYGGGLGVPAMPARLVWEQTTLPKLAAAAGLDVLFCPNGIVPWRGAIPAVPLFQNVGPFAKEVSALRSPHDWLWFRTLRVFLRRSAARASRVIVVSQHLKELVVREFGIPPARADVIYHGRETRAAARPDPALLERLGIRGDYLLSVAHLYPYKRIPELIRGYGAAARELRSRRLQLVLVGRANSEADRRRLLALVRAQGLDRWVLLAGPLPHPLTLRLLAGCRAFVFQSTCESFGISLLEALAAGVPVACARASVMPELAADAALYYDPYDPRDIGRALAQIAGDEPLRADLSRRALQRAAQLPSWADTARLTLQSLEAAARGASEFEVTVDAH